MQKSQRSIPRIILAGLFAFALLIPVAYAQSASPSKTGDWGIIIKKKDISSTAKFYPYSVNDKPMEVFAVKASDGTIRTALNTCQVCYSSGRGYYKQQGNVLVCQNCGNRFSVDQIELIKGGCNPVPILGKDKADLGDSIGISRAYLTSMAPYFARWKK